MRAERSHVALLVALLEAAALAAGCMPRTGPPPIALGASCAACGMPIQSLRFACERRAAGRWRAFDSIECLLREARAGEPAWVADYDSGTLHASDSVWVVRGDLPSPMGGGLAAFLDRAAADDVAARTHGRVETFEAVVSRSEGRP